MIHRFKLTFITTLLLATVLNAQKILVPMEETQTDHLKAYGVAFWMLEHGENVEWLLNYRGGSFLMNAGMELTRELRLRGVSFENVPAGGEVGIYSTIDQNNMDVVLLEKAPKIGVYTPPDKAPWDDAVTLALTYAEINYDKLWDADVLDGKLADYDWLHLHHEDFTGQYGKFYRNYSRTAWYQEQQRQYEAFATSRGFKSVALEKKAVARNINRYVEDGGFLFAMCSATDALDIAIAAYGVDIVDQVYDHSPIDPNAQSKLDFSKTLAFTNFHLITDPYIYEYSDIDYPPSTQPRATSAEADYFTLFEFSAKWDPVPTMLTQDHVSAVKGFMGQTTGFKRELIKKHVIILGDVPGGEQVKYLHGNAGKGTFTFLGGHDPEDYQHFVGDPPTQLSLHRNSPGYRLILNNVLFPAAKKKERKT